MPISTRSRLRDNPDIMYRNAVNLAAFTLSFMATVLMIGAVAYGWGFSQAAIAGITPIEYMMEVYDQTKPKEKESKDVRIKIREYTIFFIDVFPSSID